MKGACAPAGVVRVDSGDVLKWEPSAFRQLVAVAQQLHQARVGVARITDNTRNVKANCLTPHDDLVALLQEFISIQRALVVPKLTIK